MGNYWRYGVKILKKFKKKKPTYLPSLCDHLPSPCKKLTDR